MGANAELVKLMGPQLELVLPVLDERARRLVLAAVARAAGDGGITAVAKAAGASWQTVANGAAELESGQARRPGGSAARARAAGSWPNRSGAGAGAAGAGGGLHAGDPESPLAVDDQEREEPVG